jgi:hypothetical protein
VLDRRSVGVRAHRCELEQELAGDAGTNDSFAEVLVSSDWIAARS